MQNELQLEVNSRGIQSLFHFSPFSNCLNIASYGLIGRENLNKLHFIYQYTDAIRLDQNPNHLSVSISYPNYKMLYKKKKEDVSKKIFIVELSPVIIYEKECIFYEHNAASTIYYSENRDNSIDSFRNIFENNRNGGIDKCYTADPQAEIMVKDYIEPHYIKSFIFETTLECNSYIKYIHDPNYITVPPNIPIRIIPELFNYGIGKKFGIAFSRSLLLLSNGAILREL